MEKNKPVLYLHGGMHRTGTTAIQEFLAINYSDLLKKSILYPITGRDNILQHHYFFASFRIHKDQYFGPQKSFEQYIADLENEIKKERPEKVILSSEIFCTLDKEPLSILKDKLGQLFSLFKKSFIILYVRRPDIYAISENNMAIWYLNRRTHNLEYPNIIGWIDIVGKEKLIYRPFEQQQLEGGTIFSDFLSIIDDINASDLRYPEKKINESVCDDVLELCRIINNAHPDVYKSNYFKREIIRAFPNQESPQNAFFSPKDRLAIIEKNRIQCELIAKEFLGREDGQLFYEPLPDHDDAWEPYHGLPIETVVQAFSYLILKLQKENNDILQRITHIEDQFNKIESRIEFKEK